MSRAQQPKPCNASPAPQYRCRTICESFEAAAAVEENTLKLWSASKRLSCCAAVLPVDELRYDQPVPAPGPALVQHLHLIRVRLPVDRTTAPLAARQTGPRQGRKDAASLQDKAHKASASQRDEARCLRQGRAGRRRSHGRRSRSAPERLPRSTAPVPSASEVMRLSRMMKDARGVHVSSALWMC